MEVRIEEELLKRIAKNLGVSVPKTDAGRAQLIRFLFFRYEKETETSKAHRDYSHYM